MQKTQARQFGESLVDRHVVSREVLEDAMDESARMSLPLPAVILQRGLAGTKDLAAAFCAAAGVRFVDFDGHSGPDPGGPAGAGEPRAEVRGDRRRDRR